MSLIQNVPKSIQVHATKLREVRIKQRWISTFEALKQCEKVAAQGATFSTSRSARSASGDKPTD